MLRSLVAPPGGLGLPNLLADLLPGRPWMTFSLREPDESHTHSQTGRGKVSVFPPPGWGHQLGIVKSVFDRTTLLPGAVLGSGYLRSSKSLPSWRSGSVSPCFFQGRPQLNVGESSAEYVCVGCGGWRLGGGCREEEPYCVELIKTKMLFFVLKAFG